MLLVMVHGKTSMEKRSMKIIPLKSMTWEERVLPARPLFVDFGNVNIAKVRKVKYLNLTRKHFDSDIENELCPTLQHAHSQVAHVFHTEKVVTL